MEACKHFFYKHKPLIMYTVAGALSTLVNWVTYACCTNILPIPSSKILITTSNIIAWFITLIFAYAFYKNWVFESKTDSLHDLMRELLSFTGARMVTGVIEVFGVPFLVALGMNHTIMGVQGFAAKICVTLIVTILNYVFSKMFVFKKHA